MLIRGYELQMLEYTLEYIHGGRPRDMNIHVSTCT